MRMILSRVIDTCNWCKHQNIECEKCTELYGACERNMAILGLGKHLKSDWIPCSERLPDSPEQVLVTKNCGYCNYEVTLGEYWGKEHSWGNTDVIAWMPLPDPYIKEDDSK